MLRAIGIGYSRSLPSAAALNWVLGFSLPVLHSLHLQDIKRHLQTRKQIPNLVTQNMETLISYYLFKHSKAFLSLLASPRKLFSSSTNSFSYFYLQNSILLLGLKKLFPKAFEVCFCQCTTQANNNLKIGLYFILEEFFLVSWCIQISRIGTSVRRKP